MVFICADAGDDLSARSLAAVMRAVEGSADIKTFNNFTPADAADGSVTLVAHTDPDRKTIGDKTPKQLAAYFAEKYKKSDKSALQHIYLISCEAGIPAADGKSLAQQLAAELVKQNFPSNIKVHAVAPPAGTPMAEMRVEVVEREGSVMRGQVGQINAYLFQESTEKLEKAIDDLAKEIDDLEERMRLPNHRKQTGWRYPLMTDEEFRKAGPEHTKLTELKRDKEKELTNNRFDFLSMDNYKDVFNQPCNTFTSSGPGQPVMSDSVAFAIKFLLRVKRVESSEYIERDIRTLQLLPNPNLKADEIIALLSKGHNRRSLFHPIGSSYLAEIIDPLAGELHEREQQNAVRHTAAASVASTSGSHAAAQVSLPPAGRGESSSHAAIAQNLPPAAHTPEPVRTPDARPTGANSSGNSPQQEAKKIPQASSRDISISKKDFDKILNHYVSQSFWSYLHSISFLSWIPATRSKTMKVLTALSNTVLNGDENATFTRKQIEDALKLGDHSVHRQKLFSGDPVEKSKSGTDAVIDELREKFTSGPGYS